MDDTWEPSYSEDLFESTNYVARNQRDDPCYDRKEELLLDCKRLVGIEGSCRKPLNVAIIGPPGCGKSALLNTLFASFNSDRWFEFAKCGEFGKLEGAMGNQVSRRLKSFPKQDYYRQNDICLMPTFLDMTGFENDDSEVNKELLDLIFRGRVSENEVLNNIIRYGRFHGTTAMRERYQRTIVHRRVNRIIIVCSSNPDSAIPSLLLRTVVQVANNLDITFYGVMTHADKYKAKYNTKVAKREETFMKLLGLPRNRFARVVNYCPDVDPDLSYEDTVIPSLDVPVLRLMRQILTPETSDTAVYREDYVKVLIESAPVVIIFILIIIILKFQDF